MAAAKKTNWLKVKSWGPSGTLMELEGPTLTVLDLTFTALTTEKQARVLAVLTQTHQKRLDREAAVVPSNT